MENSKEIQDKITSLAIQARALAETADKEKRELHDDEATLFDDITSKQIPELKTKLSSALSREQTMLDLSKQDERRTRLGDIREILDSSPQRAAVLPINGCEPGTSIATTTVHRRMGKLRAFKDDSIAYQSGMWLRAVTSKLYNRDDVQALTFCHNNETWRLTNSAGESTGAGGGYTVPAPLANTIIDYRERVGVSRRICRIIPMTADTLSIAKRSGGLTVYYPNEASLITASDKTWGQIELIAKKRAVAHQISSELVDDALIAIVDDAVSEMAHALALKEDDELINGSGTSTYGGVTGLLSSIGSAGVATAATNHDTWPELDIADFVACVGKLPDKFNMEPSWLCSSNFFYTAMLSVLGSAGGNTVMTLQEGAGNARFLGYPVNFSDRMPTATAAATVAALFGSFPMAVTLGDRMGVNIARSDDYAFLNDMTTIRATARYDIKVHEPGTSSAAGAYVALKTAA